MKLNEIKGGTRTVYLIVDENDPTSFVVSSLRAHFGKLDSAAIFQSASNAEKAVREVNAKIKKYGHWVDQGHAPGSAYIRVYAEKPENFDTYDARSKELIKIKKQPAMKVQAFKLVPA